MKTSAVISALNDAIRIEHTLSMQCYQQARTVRGLWRIQLEPFFDGLAEEAREHARKFGNKVAALGGTPAVELGTVTLSEEPEQMLADALELEKTALVAYLKALELCADDVAMRTMLEDHIESEQRHIEELELLTQDKAPQPQSVRRAS